MAATPDGALIIDGAPNGNELVEMWRGNMRVAYPISSLQSGYPASTVSGVTPSGALICQGSPTGDEVITTWVNGSSEVAYHLRTLSGDPPSLTGRYTTPDGVTIITTAPDGDVLIEAWRANTPLAFTLDNIIPSVPPVAASQWWQPGAYADFDVENSRFYLNGVEYASAAAMVTAGAVTTVTGGGWSAPLPPSDQYSVVVDAITSASGTPGALEMAFSTDDGGVITTDEFTYIGRTTGNVFQASATTGSVQVAALSMNSIGASASVRASARFKANAFVTSRDGGNGVSDTAGALPATARFTIGNRFDGARPWGGTIKRVTILLTREFTKEQCELMSGVGLMRGLVNSWWNEQLAFTQAGKTYVIAYNTRDDRQYAVVMDAVSRKVLDFKALTTAGEIPEDDHSTGAFPGQLLPNGQLCQINGGHDDEAFLRFQRSTNDMPGNLGETIQIPLGYASTVSYAQLFLNGTDLFAICQTRGNAYWDIFKSSDYGDNWTRLKTLVHGTNLGLGGPNQWYIAGSQNNGGIVTFYTQLHPGNTTNQIRKFRLDLDNGDLVIGSVAVGNIYSGDNDTAITEISACELVRTAAVGHSQRLLAVRADGLAIAIADTGDTWATCDYILGLDTGSWAFNLITAGSSFGAPNNVSYVGGAIFAEHVHSGHLLYTASSASGNNLLIQQASPDGITWTPTTIVNNAAVKTMRPICPKGATSTLAVIVQRAPTYNDFNDMVVDAYAYAAA